MKKQLTQSSLHCYRQDRWRYFTREAKLMSCLVQQPVLLFCPTIPTQWVLHRWRSQSSLPTCFPAHRRANAWSPLETFLQFKRGILSAHKFMYGCQWYRFNIMYPYESILPTCRSSQLPSELPWFAREGRHSSPAPSLRAACSPGQLHSNWLNHLQKCSYTTVHV